MIKSSDYNRETQHGSGTLLLFAHEVNLILKAVKKKKKGTTIALLQRHIVNI